MKDIFEEDIVQRTIYWGLKNIDQIMSAALNQAIECRDMQAQDQILTYSKEHRILITIERHVIKFMIDSQEWRLINKLIKHSCLILLVDHKIFRSMRFSDVIEITYDMNQFTHKERVTAIVALQKKIDIENLAQLLVKKDSMEWNETGETIFKLLADKRLSIDIRNNMSVQLLREAIHQDRFDLAIKLWKKFETVATIQV